jgi:hypothetical protein
MSTRLAQAWSKGRIIGQKLPLQRKHAWASLVLIEIAA